MSLLLGEVLLQAQMEVYLGHSTSESEGSKGSKRLVDSTIALSSLICLINAIMTVQVRNWGKWFAWSSRY